MMKVNLHVIYKITAASILIMLLLMMISGQRVLYAQQDDNINKDESVYALLGSDGAVTGIYVINGFESDEAKQVTDYGNYSSITNLTTKDPLVIKEDNIQVPVKPGRFYYQGNMKDLAMPWQFDIDYMLEGAEIAAADLIGKSGAVKINFSVSPGDMALKDIYDHYTLQISFSLPAERFTNIKASGGTLANAGKNKTIVFSHLPGKEKTYTIEAETTGFEMESIQISGVFMAIEVELGDTKTLTSGLTALKDGIGSLYDGAEALQSGGQVFASGLTQLTESTNPLVSGSGAFKEGLNQTAAGLETLVAGGSQLKALAQSLAASQDPQVQALAGGFLMQLSGLEELNNGLKALSFQYGSLHSGIKTLAQGLGQLPIGYGQLQGGIDSLTDGVLTLKEETKYLDSQVETGINEMIDNFSHKDYEMRSFTDARNSVSSLQFVIRTEALKLPEKKTDALLEEEDKSFFERLLDLFRKQP